MAGNCHPYRDHTTDNSVPKFQLQTKMCAAIVPVETNTMKSHSHRPANTQLLTPTPQSMVRLGLSLYESRTADLVTDHSGARLPQAGILKSLETPTAIKSLVPGNFSSAEKRKAQWNRLGS